MLKHEIWDMTKVACNEYSYIAENFTEGNQNSTEYSNLITFHTEKLLVNFPVKFIKRKENLCCMQTD